MLLEHISGKSVVDRFLLALVLSIPSALPAESMLVRSFEEAKALAVEQKSDPRYDGYHHGQLIPYFGRKYSQRVRRCYRELGGAPHSSLSFVAALNGKGQVLEVYANRDTAMTRCILKHVSEDTFPAPFLEPYYFFTTLTY